jgi:hypothetical protein
MELEIWKTKKKKEIRGLTRTLTEKPTNFTWSPTPVDGDKSKEQTSRIISRTPGESGISNHAE